MGSEEIKIIRNEYEDPLDQRYLKDILRSFRKNDVHILNFHNAKYDVSLWKVIGLPEITRDVVKDGQLYAIEFVFEDRYFIIKDTYKKIVCKLDDFGKKFGLDVCKQHYIMYDLYRESCRLKNRVEVRDAEIKDLEECIFILAKSN